MVRQVCTPCMVFKKNHLPNLYIIKSSSCFREKLFTCSYKQTQKFRRLFIKTDCQLYTVFVNSCATDGPNLDAVLNVMFFF